MVVKNRSDFLVPAAVIAAFTVLGFVGLLGRLEGRVYNLFLHVKPPIPENSSILLLDVDDLAISRVGVWPWGRDIMANGLILLRELGASYATFDIEYVNPSPRGVDGFVLRSTVPDAFNQEFAQIETNIQQLFDAIRNGSIPLKDAGRYAAELSGLTAQGKQRLLDAVRSVERDNDAYLGAAARFFGSAYFTVNTREEPSDAAAPEAVQYALTNLAVQNVTVEEDPAPKEGSIEPAILPVLRGAAGAGFPNVIVDPDGVRRRVDLLRSYQGKYFGQLGFRPLLAWLGNPAVVLRRGSILLKGANVPGRGVRDISIPLTREGQLLINWPHAEFLKSFRHLSYYELYLHKQLEDDLLYNLKLMSQAGYLTYYRGESGLLETYQYAESVKKEVLDGGDRGLIDEYVKARTAFFSAVGSFLDGDAKARILADIDKSLSRGDLSASEKKNVQEVRAQVEPNFQASRTIYENLMKTRDVLSRNVPGAFCIIGVTATSTTDIGVNPFASRYMNVGTHASVVNTILQGQFLDWVPGWWSLLIALVVCFVATFFISRLNPQRAIVTGAAAAVVLLGLMVLWFRLTGIYVETITPVVSMLLTFIALTAIKFLRSEREKSYVRNAFGHYLSATVVNELLSNPDKLRLGGEKKDLTAMFTDVKGFSTISEVLDPHDLVRLLNTYLTEMSDTILELGGTIDKYEGDAIISFFGAPVDFADHARRACLAAVRMKRAELALNERFLAEKLAPSTLHTRIGINTGEMVVGNMGTVQKMDYTIMGNSVNLASRLEGVNKQYGTWILMSEMTHESIGSDFLVRQLDRVRPVGFNRPVRLFELIEEKGKAEPSVEKGVGLFHEALAVFEAKKWLEAEKAFTRVLEVLPEDGPAKTYIKRCQEFAAKPPVESWDGVFNLTAK